MSITLLVITVIIINGITATPFKESECLDKLDTILNSRCKHGVISRFVLANNNELFEKICNVFVETIDIMKQHYNYPNFTCTYVKPFTKIVTQITEDNEDEHYNLIYQKNMKDLMKFFTQFGFEYLNEFLKIISDDPNSYKTFLLQSFKLIEGIHVEDEKIGNNYVKFLLQVTHLIHSFLEKNLPDSQTAITAIMELSYKSVTAASIVASYSMKIVENYGKKDTGEAIKIPTKAVQELINENANKLEYEVELVCDAAYAIITTNPIEKLKVFVNFILNLLNNGYRMLIPDFAKMISKYFCKNNSN